MYRDEEDELEVSRREGGPGVVCVHTQGGEPAPRAQVVGERGHPQEEETQDIADSEVFDEGEGSSAPPYLIAAPDRGVKYESVSYDADQNGKYTEAGEESHLPGCVVCGRVCCCLGFHPLKC